MKKILRKIKRFFDRVLGDFSDEMYWKYVHFFKKQWKEAYEISDCHQGHKKFLKMGISKIKSYSEKNGIIYDVKNIFDKKYTDLRL